MRFILFLLLASAACSQTFVNGGSCSSGGNSCNWTLSVTAGNSGVFVCTSTTTAGNTVSITDASSDTFTQIGTYNSNGSLSNFYTVSSFVATTSEVFTCHVTNNTNYQGGAGVQYSGVTSFGSLAEAPNSAVTDATTGTLSSATFKTGITIGAFGINGPGGGSLLAGFGTSFVVRGPSNGTGGCYSMIEDLTVSTCSSPVLTTTTYMAPRGSEPLSGQGVILQLFGSSSVTCSGSTRHKSISY